jgi:biopolymer transport protein ExbD
MRYRRSHHRKQEAELNITAFMNLMVILVPFLLITAVFSQMSVLDIQMPAGASSESPEEEPFQLEVIIRQTQMEVGDKKGGLIKRLPNVEEDNYDIEGLHQALQQIKAEKPDLIDITLLLEQDIAYDTLIQVMDASRTAKQVDESGNEEKAELFPNISLGSAPPASGVKQ